MIDIYEKRIIEDIEAIQEGSYHDMGNIDKYPKELSCRILQKLLEWACQPQNITSIVIARKKINEINKKWIKQYFLEVATTCIDFSDDWEYRRLVELVVLALPDLKQVILSIGEKSENEDIREVVVDFR